jgi:hypothetical protein
MNVDVRPPNEAGDVANRGLIRPPLVYLISLIEGWLAAPLGVSLVVVAIALFWFSVAKFRAAGTHPCLATSQAPRSSGTVPIALVVTRYILRSS